MVEGHSDIYIHVLMIHCLHLYVLLNDVNSSQLPSSHISHAHITYKTRADICLRHVLVDLLANG